MIRLLLLITVSLFSTIVEAQPVITRIVPSESVTLRDPSALSMAPDGSLIISDTGNNRVLAVDTKGKLLFEIGSMGSGQGEFLWPKDVAAESGIVIWVADYGNRRVTKLSRQFELQGSLTVSDESNGTAEQIDKIAASPQGDVYLYAEDSGQLLKYDPLFTLKGSLGSILGDSFIPKIRQLVYIPGRGAVWHSRGDKYLSASDPLLSQGERLTVPLTKLDDYVFTTGGSELIAASSGGVYSLDLDGGEKQVLLSESEIKEAGISDIDDIVVTKIGKVYLLESRSGSVYSVTLNSR